MRLPVTTGGGIWPLLYANGITWMSQSQAVCLLKQAARMLITQDGGKEGAGA